MVGISTLTEVTSEAVLDVGAYAGRFSGRHRFAESGPQQSSQCFLGTCEQTTRRQWTDVLGNITETVKHV